ncbi:uncharacterized protein LOC131930242 [Physella acuta]|uniref:uncharacterized protein LOC131930242 n=1 Tax=Physella acuta TaxID=109671 RepID=UPI0027DD3089|nr:uncharacterized protein LOC131930242 [Physella acuta]
MNEPDDLLKYFTGKAEAEICEGGEFELDKLYENCSKNPGHAGFIPVEELTLDHLPPRYRDDDLLEIVRCISTLTALLIGKYSSERRPQFLPKTREAYPGFESRGDYSLKTGTGRVRRVQRYSEREKQKLVCNCDECRFSENPKTPVGKLEIQTATHVVFDQSELERTTCVFFYDKGQSSTVKLRGQRIVSVMTLGDWCRFSCLTCDVSFFDKIYKTWKKFDDLLEIINDKYDEFVDEDRLAIIVSHPHGKQKQVSIGQWHKALNEADSVHSKYSYYTCTCPGSSGAYVYMVGERFTTYCHVHSCTSQLGSYSSEGGLGAA